MVARIRKQYQQMSQGVGKGLKAAKKMSPIILTALNCSN